MEIPVEQQTASFTVLTYNVHSCVGTDRVLDVGRIADVIAASGADIILLQELDVGRRRSGAVDQAQEIADRVGMASHFHPALHVDEEKYGDAILSPFPTRLARASSLPSVGEPRGAIWLEIAVADDTVNVLNTHLGLRPGERMKQIETLLGTDWLSHPQCLRHPTIFGGDLNAVPSSAVFKRLARDLTTEARREWKRLPATFPSRYPLLRLDHLFHRGPLKLIEMARIETPLARIASDHLPLMARYAFEAPEPWRVPIVNLEEGHGSVAASPTQQGEMDMLEQKGSSGTMTNFLAELGIVLVEERDLPALTVSERQLVEAYLSGRMEPEVWQRHLHENPRLANYVRSQ